MIGEHLAEIIKCVRCGKCVVVCPTFEEIGWESSSSRGRMLSSLGLCEGIEPSPKMIKGLNTCVSCGICTEVCPSGARPDEIVEIARKELRSKGYQSDAHRTLAERVKRYGNTLGESIHRLNWISYTYPSSAKYVFFVGCMESYRYQSLAKHDFDILKRFGVGLLKDERCCGSPLIRTGQDASKEIAHNIKEIDRLGAEAVITSCAGCYKTLKDDYPKYTNVDFEVIHLSEFLADRLSELPLRRLDIKVTYHDPCHIGRSFGIYDEPRRIIRSVCELVEMSRIREDSRCCGGGGGVRIGYEELSLSLASKRLGDVPDGVDYIVTPCPLCERNLTDAGGRVLHLSSLLKMALNKSDFPSGNRS
jgi:Fe-S oxidoreductase